MKNLILSTVLAVAVAGCSRTETDETPETESGHDNKMVTLTAENLQHVTIKTEPARFGNLGMTLKAAGRVSANLNKTARITTALQGRVTRLYYDLNAPVKAGSVVAELESPELLGGPLQLKAPRDGVVIERNATVGELVDPSTAIYTISDPSQLWVIAEVKERDIAAVQPGQMASFVTLAYPGEEFFGRVVLVGNQVEPGTRTLEARIVVDNADGRLKPGMFADVEIVTTILESVLLIPDSALQTDEEDQIVFVARDNNQFEKRVVRPGLEQSGRVQVLEGLHAGEQVVTEGSFILKSEMLKDQLGEE